MISRLLRRLSAAILTMVLAGMFAAFPALAADEAANQDPAESPIGAVFKWLNFAVVIGAIGYFVAKKAPPYFRGHADQIASAIESAQAAKAEADRQLREAEAGLARLDTETAAMREALKKEFEDEAQRLRLAGKQEIERIDRAADVEIAAALRLARACRAACHRPRRRACRAADDARPPRDAHPKICRRVARPCFRRRTCELKAIADRYASALLDVAQAQGSAEKVKANLDEFAAEIVESPDLQHFLENPAVLRDAKRAVLARLLALIGASPIMSNFLNVVVDHRRAGVLPEIAEAYTARLNDRLGIAIASVTSSSEMSAQEKARLVQGLEVTTGKKIEAQYAVDPALLGGAVVRIGSVIYDGSVKEQLRRIEAALAVE
jgi:F-type H+-transporting ATPase subunit delta